MKTLGRNQRKHKNDPPVCLWSGKPRGQRKQGTAQTHQLERIRVPIPDWLPGYIVDFSREFHDEAATTSNITRAAHLFEWAGMDADAFIQQVYAARRITQGRANIRKRAEVGTNPAWPDGFPNRMPYFFSVLENLLAQRAGKGERPAILLDCDSTTLAANDQEYGASGGIFALYGHYNGSGSEPERRITSGMIRRLSIGANTPTMIALSLKETGEDRQVVWLRVCHEPSPRKGPGPAPMAEVGRLFFPALVCLTRSAQSSRQNR